MQFLSKGIHGGVVVCLLLSGIALTETRRVGAAPPTVHSRPIPAPPAAAGSSEIVPVIGHFKIELASQANPESGAPAAEANVDEHSAIDELSKAFERNLSPAFEKVSESVRRDLRPALEAIDDDLERELNPALARLGAGFKRDFRKAFKNFGRDFEREVTPALEKIAEDLEGELMPALEKVGAEIERELKPALRDLGEDVLSVLEAELAEQGITFDRKAPEPAPVPEAPKVEPGVPQ